MSLRLCKHGPDHDSLDCHYAHSLCELCLPPSTYGVYLNSGKADRWVGQKLTGEQQRRIKTYLEQDRFSALTYV